MSREQANRTVSPDGYTKAAVAGGSKRQVRGAGRAKPRFITCPICGAEPKVSCMTATGKPTTHTARRRLATRISNQERGI